MPLPLIPIAMSLAQAGYGFYQGQKQKKMAEDLKPSNFVPNSVKEAVDTARIASSSTQLPGMDSVTNKLRTGSANTINNAERSTNNPNQIQQVVADTDAREKEILKDLAVSNESFRAQNRGQLTNLLGVKGQYEHQSFNAYNATKSALTGAAMRNKYNAVTGLAQNLIMSMPDATGKPAGEVGAASPAEAASTKPIDLKTGAPSEVQSALEYKPTAYSDLANMFKQKLMSKYQFLKSPNTY